MPFANKKPVIVETAMEPPEVVSEVKHDRIMNEWWDGKTVTHPMDDTQFVQAFCEHVFLTTEDRSLRVQRNRCFRFIRNFMRQDLEAELSRYRAAHL